MSLSTLCLAHPAEDFPGETFRVLKNKEEKAFGEYRTRRLVLEAWERQAIENTCQQSEGCACGKKG